VPKDRRVNKRRKRRKKWRGGGGNIGRWKKERLEEREEAVSQKNCPRTQAKWIFF
jgi:hypothetical protein